MSLENAKKAAGEKAASLIQDGMLVGIGTGSTVFYFIKALIHRCRKGLRIQAISSSEQSTKLARDGGLSLLNPEHFSKLDITVDGADEIDPQFNMIKGGGGALFREKIIAYNSKKMIVIADESKLSKHLGTKALPIEISPFGLLATEHSLKALGFQPALRKQTSGEIYLTDNNNYIFDVRLKPSMSNLKEVEATLHHIPGVIETGLFLKMTGHLIVGYQDGHIEERTSS